MTLRGGWVTTMGSAAAMTGSAVVRAMQRAWSTLESSLLGLVNRDCQRVPSMSSWGSMRSPPPPTLLVVALEGNGCVHAGVIYTIIHNVMMYCGNRIYSKGAHACEHPLVRVTSRNTKGIT